MANRNTVERRGGRGFAVVRVLTLLGALLIAAPAPASLLEAEGARAFIDEVAERHDLNAAELRGIFRGLEHRDAVIEAIRDPAEALPWYRYRPIFVTADRAARGAAYQAQHANTLARAEAEYGVPAEIIVAIIGVETGYGAHTGEHPVLATLATLAFAYPPRSDFFRSELEHFLLLARDEGVDPTAVKGSYAGAMGIPQFIASSYRRYAVDFSGDGERDLLGSDADAIGSVANYLAEHGWRRGEPIAAPASAGDNAYAELVGTGLETDIRGADLRAADVEVEHQPVDDAAIMLLELEGEDGHELWVGWENFRVITRYNHSPLYALATFELAERIAALMED